MAFLNRIFSIGSSTNGHAGVINTPTVLPKESVRILLFKEHQWQDRQTLFDSSGIVKAERNQTNKTSSCTNLSSETSATSLINLLRIKYRKISLDNYRGDLKMSPNKLATKETLSKDDFMYKLNKLPDVDVLGEIVFGSVPLACKHSSVKVHVLNEDYRTNENTTRNQNQPRYLMITHVFPMQYANWKKSSRRTSTSTSSVSKLSSRSGAESMSRFNSINVIDSGVDSTSSMVNKSPSQSFNQRNCLKTNNSSGASFLFDSEQRIGSKMSSFGLDVESQSSGGVGKNVKYGLSLIVQLEKDKETEYFSTLTKAMTYLNMIMWRLRDNANKAIHFRHSIHSIMLSGFDEAHASLNDIFYNHYHSLPSSTSNLNTRKFHLQQFMTTFIDVILATNCKNTNFFFSSLLTAVLTNHLNWVSAMKRCGKVTVTNDNLLTLYGICGKSTKLGHVVICGKNNLFILSQLLSVISIFMRFNSTTSPTTPKSEKKPAHLKIGPSRTDKCLESIGKTATNIRIKRTKNSLSNLNDLSDTVETNHQNTVYEKCDKCLKMNRRQPSLEKITKRKVICHMDKYKCYENKCDNTCLSNRDKVVFTLGDDDDEVGQSNESEISTAHFNEKLIRKISKYRKILYENTQMGNQLAMIRKMGFTRRKSGLFNDDEISANNSDLHTSCSSEDVKNYSSTNATHRSKSLPPQSNLSESKCQRHRNRKTASAAVKFDFEQHKQIFTNYMKSKNLDLHKTIAETCLDFKFDQYDDYCVDCDTSKPGTSRLVLQTPSNASEQFSGDFPSSHKNDIMEITVKVRDENDQLSKMFKYSVDSTPSSPEVDIDERLAGSYPAAFTGKLANLAENSKKIPLLSSPMDANRINSFNYALIRDAISTRYVAGAVLQATTQPISAWKDTLKRDLALATNSKMLGKSNFDAVAVVADVDSWDVQIISMNYPRFDSNSNWHSNLDGVQVLASYLISDMLDVLVIMWKSKIPPEKCFEFVQDKLQEIYLQSFALSKFLLASDFCDITTLASALKIHPTDVPLLLSVASTHTPQIAFKYGVILQ